MKIVSLILARGGSKGIPEKNIIDLKGKPLIHYTILASQNSNVHETWVSTDCKKIKKASKLLGVNVIDRPLELAQDTSQSDESLLHFSDNHNFDILVFIQPTSPLLSPKYINEGIDLLLNSTKYDSVCSVYREHWIPKWSIEGKPINWNIKNRPRRQDKVEKYVENGAFYITTKNNLKKYQLRYGGNIGFVEMKLSESFQIDTFDDLALIKKIL
jgi:N-acylneuraminate cytidylyltransferase